MKYLIFSFFFAIATCVFAQSDASFSVESSKNEVLLGNAFALTFTIKNLQNAKFQAPEWSEFGLEWVGGPSQSTSMQIINGDVTSSASYTYYVRPLEEGTVSIPAQTLEHEGSAYSTEAITVNVLPNPNGIVEERQPSARPFDPWSRPTEPAEAPKKKRKTVKL